MKKQILSLSSILPATILLFTMFLVSCEDFIEKDLSGKTVTVYAPANNTISSSFTQYFWWEDLKGAEQYQLQIVKPSFNAIQALIVDTTISSNQFSYVLQPGTYQWRIRGKNNSSVGDFNTYNLTIDSTFNLSLQILLLNTPGDNWYANSFSQTLTWYGMPNATNYVFGIYNQLDVQIGSSQTTTSTSVTNIFPSEGIYKWKVFAQNSQSASPFSYRTITIDTTRPAVPTVTYLPVNDTTSLNPIPLSWNVVETSGVNYWVQISTDSTFASVLPIVSATNNYNFSGSTLGQLYFWRVKTVDYATNQSVYSAYRRIKRQ